MSKSKAVILDTDTANETDDQFAVAYAMLADDIDLKALCAAPFYDEEGVRHSMLRSYDEMKKVRDMIDPEGKKNVPCYHGSESYMKNIATPVVSEAAENIVRICRESKDMVYIAVIGCFTNVASAILMDPSIIEKAVVVLIGSNPYSNGHANEYNLEQDRNAAKVIFECGIPLVIIPAAGVTEKLYTTTAELEYYLRDQAGEIGNYLCDLVNRVESAPITEDGERHSKIRIIWDIASIGFVRNATDFFETEDVDRRTRDYLGNWQYFDKEAKVIMVKRCDRDKIYSDMFSLLQNKTI